ncbi:MAG: hypothetical protein ACJA01_001185 [Saprospiraceae bacterium]|jgi:hypothetical protein
MVKKQFDTYGGIFLPTTSLKTLVIAAAIPGFLPCRREKTPLKKITTRFFSFLDPGNTRKVSLSS